MQKMKATLILENGMTFAGRSIGSGEERICEMVFNTSMTGYQEILTDPSYAGQGIVMSYPLIGNYGVNHEDNESTRPWAEAFIVRHLARRGSNFRCEDGLDSYLKQFHITGIEGVDTRALTRILRSQGTMNGMITCAEHFSVPECLERIRAYRVEGTVERVTRREPQMYPALGERRLRVALMDYGVKENMIRCLQNRGCEVTVFPARTPAEAVLSGGFDGVMLSNGPGDPADNVEIITEVRKLYESELPLFAVCLGHQLLALATGAETRKMRFGHRGGQSPGEGSGARPGLYHQPEPRLCGYRRERGPGGGGGVPHQRQRGQRGGPALPAAQLLHRPVPPGGCPRPHGHRVSV